jgi:hypothetical protein
MGLAAGINAAIALRILGIAPNVPIGEMRRFLPAMWFGFWLNFVSGVVLLIGYPTKALTNPLFYLKLTLVALGVWLVTTVLYDGFVLAATVAFGDYPLEKPLLALMVANPVDLARVLVLTQLDVSALMGYTGALFQQTFGTSVGTVVAVVALVAWCAAPLAMAARRFRLRDF